MQNFYSVSVYTNVLAEMLNKLSQTYGVKFTIVNIVYETQQTILLVYMLETPVEKKEIVNVSKIEPKKERVPGAEVIRGGGVADTNSPTQSKLFPNPGGRAIGNKKNTASTMVSKTQATPSTQTKSNGTPQKTE